MNRVGSAIAQLDFDVLNHIMSYLPFPYSFTTRFKFICVNSQFETALFGQATPAQRIPIIRALTIEFLQGEIWYLSINNVKSFSCKYLPRLVKRLTLKYKYRDAVKIPSAGTTASNSNVTRDRIVANFSKFVKFRLQSLYMRHELNRFTTQVSTTSVGLVCSKFWQQYNLNNAAVNISQLLQYDILDTLCDKNMRANSQIGSGTANDYSHCIVMIAKLVYEYYKGQALKDEDDDEEFEDENEQKQHQQDSSNQPHSFKLKKAVKLLKKLFLCSLKYYCQAASKEPSSSSFKLHAGDTTTSLSNVNSIVDVLIDSISNSGNNNSSNIYTSSGTVFPLQVLAIAMKMNTSLQQLDIKSLSEKQQHVSDGTGGIKFSLSQLLDLMLNSCTSIYDSVKVIDSQLVNIVGQTTSYHLNAIHVPSIDEIEELKQQIQVKQSQQRKQQHPYYSLTNQHLYALLNKTTTTNGGLSLLTWKQCILPILRYDLLHSMISIDMETISSRKYSYFFYLICTSSSSNSNSNNNMFELLKLVLEQVPELSSLVYKIHCPVYYYSYSFTCGNENDTSGQYQQQKLIQVTCNLLTYLILNYPNGGSGNGTSVYHYEVIKVYEYLHRELGMQFSVTPLPDQHSSSPVASGCSLPDIELLLPVSLHVNTLKFLMTNNLLPTGDLLAKQDSNNRLLEFIIHRFESAALIDYSGNSNYGNTYNSTSVASSLAQVIQYLLDKLMESTSASSSTCLAQRKLNSNFTTMLDAVLYTYILAIKVERGRDYSTNHKIYTEPLLNPYRLLVEYLVLNACNSNTKYNSSTIEFEWESSRALKELERKVDSTIGYLCKQVIMEDVKFLCDQNGIVAKRTEWYEEFKSKYLHN